MAQVIRHFSDAYQEKHKPNGYVRKTFKALEICRTSALGGHLDACTDCGVTKISYNSCRNRHCPKCQNTQRENWIELMEHKTLPVPYFHVVFTVPEELNGLFIRYPEKFYSLLFNSAWQTIKGFAENKQYGNLQTGMTAVLHTWGQQLMLHPHVHCIVPFGGIMPNGKWKRLKGKGNYLYPMPELKKVYKSKFLAGIRKLQKEDAIEKQGSDFLESLFQKQWVVFAKRRFGNEKAVIEYLGRYTHKVAISNHRLQRMDNKTITFKYKEYRKNGQQQEMTLTGQEFMRRYALHFLPKGFMKIRHYGLHAGAASNKFDTVYRQLKGKERVKRKKKSWQELAKEKLHFNPKMCPHCQTETMKTIEKIPPNKPPPNQLKKIDKRDLSTMF